jgi:lipid A disaccharide synthetase
MTSISDSSDIPDRLPTVPSPFSHPGFAQEALDILILSNGPGELSTWVKPVVQQLRQRLGSDRTHLRISVVLSPCPNASGREGEIARQTRGVDRVQEAQHFFPFLLFGKTVEGWDWRSKGVIVFLGGDPLFPVILGKRLGYRTVVYAEWEALWHGWIDRFAIMQPGILDRVKPDHRHKFSVVGDLMTDAGSGREEGISREGEISPAQRMIGLLPGSKAAKLGQGVPLGCAIADLLHQADPSIRFVIPLAPALDEATLAAFADPEQNPCVELMGGIGARLTKVGEQSVLETDRGTQIELHSIGDDGPCTPHYNLLRQCTLCVTTVGANTAELGALGIPMVMVLPTNQLDAMRAWNGITGLFANLPIVGSWFAKGINWWALRKVGLLSWPNIWAGRSIVPELVGKLTPERVVETVQDYLDHPEKLEAFKQELRQVRGDSGAALKMVAIVEELLAEG